MPVAITVLVVLGFVSVVWNGETAEPALPKETTQARRDASSFDESPLSGATVDPPQPLERRTIGDVDVLLQRPSEPPKGILFGAHGCSHSHTDWWPSTPETCPECIGLPEERAIVDLALSEYQFMVVAVSSQNRNSKCWSPADGPVVARVLKEVYAAEQSTSSRDKLSVVAFGASSGGGFVGRSLPEAMAEIGQPLDGFVAQIAAPTPPKQSTTQSGLVATYVTMNRDTHTDEKAQEIVEELSSQNVPAKHIRVEPLAIVPGFFHDRIPQHYTLEESKTMVEALEQAQYLDSQTKYLAQDPRRSKWREVLRPHVPASKDGFVADASPVSEVMNVARAKHELTRDGVREAIDFVLKSSSGWI